MPNKAKTKPVHLKRTDVEPDPYLSRNEFKPEFYTQVSKPATTYETLKGTAAKPIPNVTDTEYFKTGGVAALDESMAHENKESKKQEARETKLEKKGYIETKSGKMKKPKKAFLGLAVQAAQKSPMSLIGIGADKVLKNSETARNITSNLGIGGKMLSSYYDDLSANKTAQQNTPPVKAYTGRAIKQPTETKNEFQIRHEYHTPFKGPQKGKKGKMIKKYRTGDEVEFQGPMEKEGFAIEPQIRGGTSFDQNIERKTKGASLYLHTPGYGKVGVHMDKDTEKDSYGSLDTKRKAVSYELQKDIGKATLTAGASLGKSENRLREGKTKQGMLSITYPLGKSKGGVIKGKPKLAMKGWK
jgi:hypothetical protein